MSDPSGSPILRAMAESVSPHAERWLEHWRTFSGVHSMLRCPGEGCPGSCGAGAQALLAEIMAERKE